MTYPYTCPPGTHPNAIDIEILSTWHCSLLNKCVQMHMYRHGLATFVFSTCLSLICAARDNDVIQLGMRLLLSFVSPLFSLTLLHGHAARQPDGKVTGMLHPC